MHKTTSRPFGFWILIILGLLYCLFCISELWSGISQVAQYLNSSGASPMQWLLDYGAKIHKSYDLSYLMVDFGLSGIPLTFCTVLLLIGSEKALRLLRLCIIPCAILSVVPTVVFLAVLFGNIGIFSDYGPSNTFYHSLGPLIIFDTGAFYMPLPSLISYIVISRILHWLQAQKIVSVRG